MKIKSIVVALAVSVVSVFGQGLVTFQNSSVQTPVRLFDGASTVNMPTGGSAYSFYFTYGTSAGSLNFTSPIYFNSAVTGGRIEGTAAGSVTLSTPAGATFFQLFAFSTAAGSYAAATATPGMYSYSSSIISQPNILAAPGAATPLFGPGVGTQFQGFTMNITPVPEPSTIALGALGIGALFFVRRRKV